jgi:hypothetical protein
MAELDLFVNIYKAPGLLSMPYDFVWTDSARLYP